MHVGGEDSPKVITLPPFIFLGAMFIAFVIQFFYPLPGFIAWPFGLLGLPLIVLGLALGMWAGGTFKKKGTEVDPRKAATAIATDGPFKYTRNPMYVGMALIMLGVALLANSLWVLIALIPALLVIRYGVIAREEKYLAAKFGQEYLDFKSRVRRWV